MCICPEDLLHRTCPAIGWPFLLSGVRMSEFSFSYVFLSERNSLPSLM